MKKNYWIKLYTEILHDPKMGMMSEHLWKRTIEMFMFAGENERNGELPPIDQMAWVLHVQPESLLVDMSALEQVGILSCINGVWIVTKFAQRQGPSPSAERMRRMRAKNDRNNSPGGANSGENNDASQPSNSDGNSDAESDGTSDEQYVSVSVSVNLIGLTRIYESEIGILTPMVSDALQDALEEYPPEWIEEALKLAAKNNKRSWSYAEAILKRWKVDGFQAKRKPANGSTTGRGDVTRNDDGSLYV